MRQKTTLLVIRHGETEDNVARRPQGQEHGTLTSYGVAQAQALGRRLVSNKFSCLYSSDLKRAYDTADLIAQQTGHSIKTEQCLRERHFGVFQGILWSDIEQLYPEAHGSYRSGDPDYVVPGGESTQELYERSVSCFKRLARHHVGDTIAVVTHGGVINCLLRHTLAIPLHRPRHFTIRNASLNVFVFDGKTWFVDIFGDVSHLD